MAAGPMPAKTIERLLDLGEVARFLPVACGHTHMPFDRRIGATRLVNAGSVGVPFVSTAGTYWLQLGSEVDLRRTSYNVGAAAERIRAPDFRPPTGHRVRIHRLGERRS